MRCRRGRRQNRGRNVIDGPGALVEPYPSTCVSNIVVHHSAGTDATLGLAALTSLGLATATSVRRRRRDLALLKALGFTGRQLGATVRWQAGATAFAGLVAGVPLGIGVGRTLWTQFATQLDMVPEVSTPFVTLTIISVVALVVALGAAALPARAARRVHPATLLHSE